jgi:hypothetical protein
MTLRPDVLRKSSGKGIARICPAPIITPEPIVQRQGHWSGKQRRISENYEKQPTD